jgi:two-component system response regulator TrcR
MKPHLLLVEDELHLARVVKDSLEQYGYLVTHAVDGKKAYNLFLNNDFGLCLIDVMLPHTDGFTLARQMRAAGSQTPILFLTAKTATHDIIEGYQSGGNDYLKKPFSLEELFLRIKELLKRNTSATELAIGHYRFIPHKQTLQYRGETGVNLSHRETQLLQLLVEHKNAVLERRQALLALWGDDSFFNTRTMDVFVTKLRKHLKNDPAVQIINLRGIGYKLIC